MREFEKGCWSGYFYVYIDEDGTPVLKDINSYIRTPELDAAIVEFISANHYSISSVLCVTSEGEGYVSFALFTLAAATGKVSV